jgi:hypothetical protein
MVNDVRYLKLISAFAHPKFVADGRLPEFQHPASNNADRQ